MKRHHLASVLVSLALGAASLPALAAPSPLAQSLTGEAKADYESGRRLFEIGDYAGALLEFKHAHGVAGDPRLLWNMAACEKELHHYRGAVALVERYLADGDARIAPDARKNASASLDALRALTAKVTFVGIPDGAQVFVDDELVGTAPQGTTLTVDVGAHKLRVEHPDYAPFEKTLDGVAGGGSTAIGVSLARASTAHLVVLAGRGDSIAVDGKVLGMEQWSGPLSAGPHRLRVTARDKTPYDRDVEIAPHATRTVEITLHGETTKRAAWPWIVGGIVVAGGAAVGGYFLFRPKDHVEPTGPEGGLGTVVLPTALRFR